jgi:hypothetical protein
MSTREATPGITVFVCFRGARTPCYRCDSRAVKGCDGPPLKAGDGVCGRPLCGDHARGSRCAQHAPEKVSTNMPTPPRPPSGT